MNKIIKIVEPSGIVDGAKANEFRQEISDSIDRGVELILIDFKNVTFMDSSGLGALVLALKTVRSAEAQMFLCSLNDQIKMLLELTSMDRVFDTLSSREEFDSKYTKKV
jgi:anti-anti-sigma factor